MIYGKLGTMLVKWSFRKNGGGLSQLAFGGPYGRKEITHVLKTGVAPYK